MSKENFYKGTVGEKILKDKIIDVVYDGFFRIYKMNEDWTDEQIAGAFLECEAEEFMSIVKEALMEHFGFDFKEQKEEQKEEQKPKHR